MQNVREIYDRRMFPLHGPWRVRECPNLHGWNQYGLRLRHRHVRLFRLKEASQRQPHHLRLQEPPKRQRLHFRLEEASQCQPHHLRLQEQS